MQRSYTTLYLRHRFSVAELEGLESLKLHVGYDDAFIVYINGVEVARAGVGTASDPVAFDGRANRSREFQFCELFDIDLAQLPDLIPAGDANVLAIQGVNRSLTDSDFVIANLQLDGILLHGDFNGNAVLDLADLAALTAEVQAGTSDGMFDIDQDGLVDLSDHAIWIEKLRRTHYGDANLDGEFNTGDLAQVLGAGKYKTHEYASWSEGEWNGDGVFDTGDLVKALDDGGYEIGPRKQAAVPEPRTLALMVTAAYFFVMRSRAARRLVLLLLPLILVTFGATHADIYRWDNREVIPGTEGIEPGPGVDLSGMDLRYADLTGENLQRANFEASNLGNASLRWADLLEANLTDVLVTWADLWSTGGLTKEQLYLTDAVLTGARLQDTTAIRRNSSILREVTGTETCDESAYWETT